MDAPDVSRVGLSGASHDLFSTGRRHRHTRLSSTVAGIGAVELEFASTCDARNATEVVPAPDEPGAGVFGAPTSLNAFQGTRLILFAGGCFRYDHHFSSGVPVGMSLQADDAFSFVPRADIVAAVRAEFDRTLYGAAAPLCEDPG